MSDVRVVLFDTYSDIDSFTCHQVPRVGESVVVWNKPTETPGVYDPTEYTVTKVTWWTNTKHRLEEVRLKVRLARQRRRKT